MNRPLGGGFFVSGVCVSTDLLTEFARLLCGMIIACVVVGASFTGMRSVESEAGLVEVMSSLALFAAVVLFCLATGLDSIRRYWYGTVILAFLCARELDLDKMLFSDGILSIKHYSGTASLWEKGLGALILTGLLLALAVLALRGFPPLLAHLRAGRVWALLIAFAVGLLVVGKSLDGLERKLADFNLAVPAVSAQIALFCEEVAELAAALCLLMAVVRLPLDRQTVDQRRWDHSHEMS